MKIVDMITTHNMKYIFPLVVVAIIVACSHKDQNGFYEIRTGDVYKESFNNQFIQINDTNRIKFLDDILNTTCNNPDIEYYAHKIFREDPCIVVRIDDYFVREYVIWKNNTYAELSFEGGDGPYYSRGYSYASKDSLITYTIEIVWAEDENMDTTLNTFTVDTIRSTSLLYGNTPPIIDF